ERQDRVELRQEGVQPLHQRRGPAQEALAVRQVGLAGADQRRQLRPEQRGELRRERREILDGRLQPVRDGLQIVDERVRVGREGLQARERGLRLVLEGRQDVEHLRERLVPRGRG